MPTSADECRVHFTTGVVLAGPSADTSPDGVDYLRVLAPDAAEAYRVTADSMREDPVAALTCLADALNGRKRNVRTEEYGYESALHVAEGWALHYATDNPGDPEFTPVDYMRVFDAKTGAEAYWVCDEFSDDPESVMGALLGALTSGPGL